MFITVDTIRVLCYNTVRNCTTVRFGRIDIGLFTYRRGKVSTSEKDKTFNAEGTMLPVVLCVLPFSFIVYSLTMSKQGLLMLIILQVLTKSRSCDILTTCIRRTDLGRCIKVIYIDELRSHVSDIVF